MTEKYTPGPWQVGKFNKEMICDCDGEARGCSPIAYVEGTAAEKRANARLIAAAPELLAALQKAVRYGGLFPDLKAEAEAAIAKATGGAA